MRASILAPMVLALGLGACAHQPCPCAAHGGPDHGGPPPGPPPGHPGGPEHGGPPPGPPPGHWGPPGHGGPGPMGPPPEALAACKELAADAACKIALPERSVEGTCRQGPEGADKPLLCVPADMPPPPGFGPPPEALAACKELAASAACKIALPARSVEGTCRKGPDPDKPLACVPAHMPPPGGPGGPPPGGPGGPPPGPPRP